MIVKESLFTNTWNKYLEYFPEEYRDIYFTEEYTRLYEDEGGKPECFIYKDGDNIFLLPYIKRKIGLLDGDYFDFETAYGYGGPLVISRNSQFVSEAFNNFYLQAKENKIVAGFIRFHPLLNNYMLLMNECRVVFNRKTIAMNLELKKDKIWSEQIHFKHRNKINIAQRNGLLYYVDEKLQYLDIFKDLYISKMSKLKADKFYFFKEDYFNNIKKNLGKNTFLGLVFLSDKIIAAALFFKYANFGHYHLSGSSEDYMKYRPNNFLIYKTALYLKEKGTKLFHLGGGNSSSLDDSLYKFKERFSKDKYSFYIGEVIIDQHLYKEVCGIWEEKFPKIKERYKALLLKYRYSN
jgi:hypothetical protein